MDRNDPLATEPDLDPRHCRPRHGHAPALWLALPFFTGCWLHAQLATGVGLAIIIGVVALGWSLLGNNWGQRTALVVGGVVIGFAWHAAWASERSPWQGKPGPDNLFLRIERVETSVDQWWALGTVEGGSPDTLRRRAWVRGEGESPRRGSLTVITGLISGEETRSGWRHAQGATLKLSRSVVQMEIEAPSAYEQARARASQALSQSLTDLAWGSERGARLLAATLLGQSRLLEEDDRVAFAATGTLHLFAISGLHIAGMAALLASAARALRLPWLAAALGALVLLAIYVEATGGSASARRAWLMAAGLLSCRCWERRSNSVQGLALAAGVTLLLDPEAATDAGFHLSYLSVGGILLAGGPAARAFGAPSEAERLSAPGAASALRRAGWWLRARTAESAAVALGASIAGAPLAVSLFNLAAPAGVFANIILVPMASVPLALGMLSIGLGCLPGGAFSQAVTNALAASWLELMAYVASAAAHLPGMGVELNWRSPVLGLLCQAGLIALLLMRAEARGGLALLGPPALWVIAWFMIGTAS